MGYLSKRTCLVAATIQAAVKDARPSVKLTIVTNNTAIDWTKVDEHAGWLKSVKDLPDNFNSKGRIIVGHTGNLEDLKFELEPAWSSRSLISPGVSRHCTRFDLQE
jgi:hypothetical protein